MRTKKTILNFATDALPQIIIILIGIFKLKIFLLYLGTQTLGLYQLYGQLVAYLALTEGGLITGALYHLYKPIAEKDNKKINEILSASRIIFNYIGIIIFIIGFLLSFGIIFLIKDNSYPISYIQITFILYLVSNVIGYFTVPYKIMFEADQKRYIPNLIFQCVNIIKSIVEIIIVTSGLGFISILIWFIITNIVANSILIIVFGKKYKNVNLKDDKDFSMLKDVKHLFVQKIGALITNNIDILLISKFLGLASIVIYSSYNYIVESIKMIIEKMYASTLSSIGNLLTKDRKKSYDIFMEYNSFVFFIATIICIPFYFLINPFINIWYDGAVSTNISIAILFSLILFYQIIRMPINVFATSAGLFKEIKKCTLIESGINLTLSFILINKLGIVGVLLATIIAFVISDYLIKPGIIHKKIFDQSVRQYYIKNFIYLFCFLSIATIFSFVFKPDFNNIFMCFIYAVGIFIANVVLVLIYYKTTNNLQFLTRINSLNIFKKINNTKRNS